jgi:hypothetical protein
MFTDDDEQSWALSFFARFFAILGTLTFGGTSFWWMSMFYLGGVGDSTMLDFSKLVLQISCIPGILLVIALLLDLKRVRKSESENWMTRTLRQSPVLFVHPYPLRWVIGLELFLLLYLNLIFVRVILLKHPH